MRRPEASSETTRVLIRGGGAYDTQGLSAALLVRLAVRGLEQQSGVLEQRNGLSSRAAGLCPGTSHSRLQGVSLEVPFPDSRPIFS